MISDYIPAGHENAISRQELVRRTGYSDRRLRAEIAEETASEKGKVILNTGEGYFIYSGPDDDLWLNTYLRQESSRFSSIGKKLRKLRNMNPKEKKEKREEQIVGQLSIFDFGGANG